MFPVLLASIFAIALASPGNFTKEYPAQWGDECRYIPCVAHLLEWEPRPDTVSEFRDVSFHFAVESFWGMDHGSVWEAEVWKDDVAVMKDNTPVDRPTPLSYDELHLSFNPIDLPAYPGLVLLKGTAKVGRIPSGLWRIIVRLLDEQGGALVRALAIVDARSEKRKVIKRTNGCGEFSCDGKVVEYSITSEEVKPGTSTDGILTIEHSMILSEEAFFSARIRENGQLLAAGRLYLHEPTPFKYKGFYLDLAPMDIPLQSGTSTFIFKAILGEVPASSLELTIKLVGDNGEMVTEDSFIVIELD